MEYCIIGLAAFWVSGLTMFSGFGLGTILMPVFAVFFPVDVSIALTAVVHLFNNLFKWFLFGKSADKKIIIKFGIPGMFAAFIGAYFLICLGDLNPIFSYHWGQKEFFVAPIKLCIALAMIGFVILEVVPKFHKMTFDPKHLFLGGILSGFFGGFSGHQGALRSAFLTKCGLSKESFIATGVVIACLVDITRLSMYWQRFSLIGYDGHVFLLAWAIGCVFLGVIVASRLLTKMTIKSVQMIVSVMLIVIALGLGLGII